MKRKELYESIVRALELDGRRAEWFERSMDEIFSYFGCEFVEVLNFALGLLIVRASQHIERVVTLGEICEDCEMVTWLATKNTIRQ